MIATWRPTINKNNKLWSWTWETNSKAPLLLDWSPRRWKRGEHDFNILGNGQKEDLEEKPHRALPRGQVHGARGKEQTAARLQSACWVTDSSTVCGLEIETKLPFERAGCNVGVLNKKLTWATAEKAFAFIFAKDSALSHLWKENKQGKQSSNVRDITKI